ncbi:DUF2382 domain-containing protein [Actinoplanes sp. Pm04-4]|uniref:DUF2382 domain-containing protein n=1 Tax=Paractinoplanes pyxinae TaxID=2997416 RepID=A0ABT4BBC0_9ACTN|nr:DUF2382 domain-containing protein [Actinoplanes pyxinae]MCY1143777.1 DUF2382 domain-containing protein [Actinoplanes pyxinae]
MLQDPGEATTRSEERLVSSTQVHENGRARLRKYVITETVQITVQVRSEQLRLEQETFQRPVSRRYRIPTSIVEAFHAKR